MAPWWLSSKPDEALSQEGLSPQKKLPEGISPAPSPGSFSELHGNPKSAAGKAESGEARQARAEGVAGNDPERRRRRRRHRRSARAESVEAEEPQETAEEPPVTPQPLEPRETTAEAEPKPKKERKKRKKRKKEHKKSRPEQGSEPALENHEPATVLVEDDGLTVESISNEVVYVPERGQSNDERKIAMFVDFENIALGVRDSEIKTLDVGLLLERLLEKGKIIVKRAYADWERYSDFKRPLHEAAIELIDIPQKSYSGKNSADIKMVVDAMDLCYSKEHLDTFVLVSGDSDFSPLVSKLKENDKYVMGLGVKNASSNLLIDNCDEFIYYEDVWRDSQRAPRLDQLPKKEAECFQLLVEAMQALLRENKDVLWGSMIKQTMKRKRPSFNEGYYGYSAFSELLQDAERKHLIRLRRDRRSGSYVVMGFAPRKKH